MDTRTYPARGGTNRATIVLGALAAAWSVVAVGPVPALAQDPSPPAARPTLPADPARGKAYPLRINDANRRVRLIVDSAARIGEYGTHKPADGRALFVVSTEWENTIPLTPVAGQKEQVPTLYKIPNLADHVYLVLDGQRVVRLDPEAGQLPGHVPTKDFTLERFGSRLRGNLVFEVPATGPLGAAELRFYDFAHGHMALPLYADADKPAEPTPLAPPQKNEVVEAGVFGIEKRDELNGTKAPEGMTYVFADLRARSMFTFPGDATAFDPKAKPGQKMQIGTVADWADADRYLQLVVDGERAYSVIRPGTTLAEQPRFLPDIMTGGQVVFLAPREAKSLEVRCDFPNAKKPDGQVLRPKGLTLQAEGQRPALAALKPIAAVDDDVYKVAVTGQRAVETFGGARPGDGEKFLVLDVNVQNVGKDGELFQTKEQLKCATADGQQREIAPATYQGVYRPTELVFIPPGERRSFQVAYAIPATETKPRLAYGGVSLAKVLDLPPLDGSAVAATPPANNNVPPATPQTPTGTDKPAGAAAAAAAAPAAPPANAQQVAVATPTNPPPTAQKAAVKPIDKLDVPRVAAKQPLEPKGLAGVGLTPEQVNKSIDRGAAFLWDYIKKNDLTHGYEFGARQEHMLAALALVHAGAHKTYPEFDATLRRYIAGYDPQRWSNTYVNGLYCMLIQSYGDPTYLPKLRQTAQWLVDQQGPNGTWGYGIAPKRKEAGDVAIRRVIQVAGGHPPDQPPGGEPIVRKTKWEEGADGDNSVTQYALLGLHAAARCDVRVPAETWQRTLKEHRARQDPKVGGFGYTTTSPGNNYGSMTAAGACALALARHALGEKEPANDPDVERALAWMSEYFTVAGNPHPSWGKPNAMRDWHYYYLYSLERVGRIMDTEFIGPHEWYPLGAKLLLGAQRSEDGGWLSKEDRNDPELSTSFALLFLTRATESLQLPKREGPGTLKTAVAAPPSTKIHVILDCSGSMLEEMEGRPKFDIAREAVLSLVDALPEQAQFGLRVYGHRKRALEEGASDDTELLVPVGAVKRDALQAKLRELRARGKTPMARSLLDARNDVHGGTADNPVIVILLTDGGEDSQPRRDPLAAADEFGKLEGVRLHVVGFDINRPEWLEQLQGMAERAHGQFLPAQKSAQLQRELKAAVFGVPESFAVVSADGKPAGSGAFGESIPLPEGKYTFRTEFAGKEFESPFWINAGSTTAVTFDAAAVANEMKTAKNAAPAAPQAPGAVADAPSGEAPPAKDSKFCTSCGAKIARAAKFCTSCGAKQ